MLPGLDSSHGPPDPSGPGPNCLRQPTLAINLPVPLSYARSVTFASGFGPMPVNPMRVVTPLEGLMRYRLLSPTPYSPTPCTNPKACMRSEEHTSELQSLRHLVCR